MLTKKEIDVLASKIARECVSGTSAPLAPAIGIATRAIEQALATVPSVPEMMVATLESIAKFLDQGGHLPSQEKQDIFAAAIDILKKLTPPDPPRPYSVLLKYPGSEVDTYLAHVEASSPTEAVNKARTDVVIENQYDLDDGPSFDVMLICEGHINDIKEG